MFCAMFNIFLYMHFRVQRFDFDFFWQNWASQTGDRCKMGFYHTFIQNIFFFERFSPILDIKLAKSARISNKFFFSQKFDMGIINAKLDAEFEKSAKQSLHFTVTFSLITFFAWVFLLLFQQIRYQHQIWVSIPLPRKAFGCQNHANPSDQ